jgi:hypothetical protein
MAVLLLVQWRRTHQPLWRFGAISFLLLLHVIWASDIHELLLIPDLYGEEIILWGVRGPIAIDAGIVPLISFLISHGGGSRAQDPKT